MNLVAIHTFVRNADYPKMNIKSNNMANFHIQNEEGLALTILNPSCNDKDCKTTLGGDNTNPSWEQYLNDYKEEYRPHISLLKKAVEELKWVGETGERIANYYCFHFSDGVKMAFTWRAWGDFMQAMVDKKEGYMKYYM